MAKASYTYEDIIKELSQGVYRPVYYLMGEEDYYIDKIADYIIENALTVDEKDFNLTVLYGADSDISTVINAAKRYPLMAERQVVVVKEAQDLRQPKDDQNQKQTDELTCYLQKPLRSTVLVFCHKHGTIDRRRKVAAEIEKAGILFESPKIKEANLPHFITTYLQQRSVSIEPKAAAMLAEFVGPDLSRLTGELDKLIITLPSGQTRVTDRQIELNIGISREYNTFELRQALIDKNILKANTIIKHFAANPKVYPIQMVLPLLFNFFANLMLAYYAPEKTDQGIAGMLGLKTTWQSRDYLTAMRNFNGVKVMQIINDIRYADAKSKGVGGNSTSDSDILRELVFKILHDV